MAKRNKKEWTITRKGLVIWIVLFFFIAGWMFVLGILIGRGMTPISLNEDRLEKEIAGLRLALIQKENELMMVETGQQHPATTQFDFYEVLTENIRAKDWNVDPNLISREAIEPDLEPDRKPPGSSPKQAHQTAPKPQQASDAKSSSQKPDIKKGDYTIQVAAYKNAAYSRDLVGRLKKKGFPAFQVQSPSGSGGGMMYRVRVGAFGDRRSAETMLAKLRSRQFNGLVVWTR